MTPVRWWMLMGDLEVAGDGCLDRSHGGPVGRGEITISTNGEGCSGGRIGKRVFGTADAWAACCASTSRFVGVAGVGASEPVNDAIFPARRMAAWNQTPVPRSAISAPRT